jgi:4,4'-diaponeurosporenoate glycosyltransferase
VDLGRRGYLSTVVTGWLAGWWLFRRVPGLPRSGPEEAAAKTVSVVIPARDEAASLPGLLASLAAQTRPPDETIVVDDHSRDDTAAAAAAAGATVLAAPALPPGWTGKAWACWTGARRATG